jgi:UDP-glucose 4-epimerase
MSVKKILVSGANGFIGMALVKELLHRNNDVTCIVRNAKNFKSKDKNVKYIDFDLKSLNRSIGSYDVVVNCVASLNYNSSWKEISDDNCSTLENLILNVDCGQFINLSSCSVFSEISKIHSQPAPISNYGLSKYVSEKILEFHSGKFDSSLVIRYPVVIGRNKLTDDFVKYIYMNSINNKDIELYGNGYYYRNVIHISEAISAIISAIESNSENNSHNEINVGSCNSERVIDICKFIIKKTNSLSKITLSKDNSLSPFDSLIDVSKCSLINHKCQSNSSNINKYLLEMEA